MPPSLLHYPWLFIGGGLLDFIRKEIPHPNPRLIRKRCPSWLLLYYKILRLNVCPSVCTYIQKCWVLSKLYKCIIVIKNHLRNEPKYLKGNNKTQSAGYSVNVKDGPWVLSILLVLFGHKNNKIYPYLRTFVRPFACPSALHLSIFADLLQTLHKGGYWEGVVWYCIWISSIK